MYGPSEDTAMTISHLLAAALFLLPLLARADASLTALETRWLGAAGPVLALAQRLALPIDIIVQPQAKPGDVPLAMGFMDGRCKLVLSLRGNPGAEAVLEQVPEAERAVLIEAMAAHEVGHCWRYAQGAWHALPAGFVEVRDEQAASADLLAAAKAMREARREEGYADLVALAWTAQAHPRHYARVHAWLAALRSVQPVARSSHDTRAWVALALDAAVFAPAATPFDAAAVAWRAGLLADD
jgi:ADP-ribose pyrophosphatase YjhB (NUDIX family)